MFYIVTFYHLNLKVILFSCKMFFSCLKNLNKYFTYIYFKGSLEGKPAFLGYLAGVVFSFVIIKRLR